MKEVEWIQFSMATTATTNISGLMEVIQERFHTGTLVTRQIKLIDAATSLKQYQICLVIIYLFRTGGKIKERERERKA